MSEFPQPSTIRRIDVSSQAGAALDPSTTTEFAPEAS
jgi:hypothetical protein